MPQWGVAKAVNQKNDSAWSVVTQLDIEVETFARSELSFMYPDIGIVGEEQGGDRTVSKFWLVDPIDGTAHYMRGLPFCTSMLALIDSGDVVFSAIYDFVRDEVYWAERGYGAYRNNDRLHVSERPLSKSWIFFETNVDKAPNAKLRQTLHKKANVLQTYCAGWEFAMVASGKIDARICLDPYGSDYDFAPGSLLVSEAGGVVLNIGSKSFDYRNLNFIAANPVVYRELTEGKSAFFPLEQ